MTKHNNRVSLTQKINRRAINPMQSNFIKRKKNQSKVMLHRLKYERLNTSIFKIGKSKLWKN
jgi:hypothetical protein